MSAVHSFMYKPSPPKYDVSPTTFSSTVDHLKITLAFMLYSSFKTFISKYIQKFHFMRYGPDISRVAVLIYSYPDPEVLVKAMWSGWRGYTKDSLQVETDVDSGFDSSYFTESLLMNQCIQSFGNVNSLSGRIFTILFRMV
eukprot:TRINITY_DN152_c0_g2_i1.p1 TRINITY_DN152_c0_g2~~TRINITY_DN152_c0_g2_i1.p1  ORF type:complete len:141 (-),score=3.43 TRINITY_DN152_c0_g2_i1:1030-1452(-)